MSIMKIGEIAPRNVRAVVPDKYKGMGYRKLKEGDIVTIQSVVFSVYNARKDGEILTTKNGDPINNVTVYLGLADGHYTSLKNDIVLAQMCALTDFDEGVDVGYYPYDLAVPEKAKIVTTQVKMGQKTYDVLAFEGIE